ncbi:MAG: zinc ABC transporter substrate-binding protein [FCB group bacterium]|jgi:zinc transport system substrate-binding protein|nr:zinc ABC transporter substrate-binding protein [FCB group bacterium]
MPKFSLIVLASLLAAACSPRDSAQAPANVIYVSIPPQAGIVRAIAGDHYEVRTLLGQGASHESYEPKPSQLEDLARAALYVRMGVPFENAVWNRVREINPKMRVVEAQSGIPPREMHAEEGHEHGDQDPHIWLVPSNMRHMAELVAQTLIEMDPSHAGEYRANLQRVTAGLDALDQDLRRELAPVQGKTFWVYHPAWGYFADAYGLRQHGIEQEGKELGTQSLTRLVTEGKEQGVRVVFLDPRTGGKSAQLVAQEIGARVEPLDPIAEDYSANLRAVARAIREAVQ